jgi:hypothetical protein
VVFDETGLSERPTVVRTWGKKGETPVIYHSFNWKQRSAIGAVTARQYYFRLHDGAIDAKRAIAFCKSLQRQITPRRARSCNPQNRVDKHAVVFRHASPNSFSSREMRLKQSPCFVTDIVTTLWICRGIFRRLTPLISYFLSRAHTI